MTWIKLDDSCISHPSLAGLSDAAFAAWVRGLCYSSHHQTDGILPSAALRFVGTSRAADELVTAGKWLRTDDGFAIHDYADHQRTRAEIAADREKWRRNKARTRDVHRGHTADTTGSPPDVPSPEVEVEVDGVLSTTAVAGTPADRQRRIMEAATLVARARHGHRADVGGGYISAAARGIAKDHHDDLHRALVNDPQMTAADLASIIDPPQPARPSPPPVPALLAQMPPVDKDLNLVAIADLRKRVPS